VKDEDDVWARYQRILTRTQETTRAVELVKEIERLHGSRSSRFLSTKSGGATAFNLIDANLQDISYRSRIVEIKITISKQHRLLEQVLGAVHGHLLSNYNEEIVDLVGKLKASQGTFVDSMIRDGWDALSKLEKVREIAEYVVEDIDKTAWAMTNLVKLVTLLAQRDNVLKLTEV
jgi:hypothetical protein